MGYQESTLKLVFEDPRYEGLEVRAKRVTILQRLELGRLAQPVPGDTTMEDAKKFIDERLHLLIDGLISWNLEDENGNPVPLTVDALWRVSERLILDVMSAWGFAATGVSDPLERTSGGGDPSLEASMTMDDLPESPDS